KLIVARRNKPYASVRELWLRTGLSPRLIERLADADALGSLGLTRRQALWAAKALGRVGDKDDDLPLFRGEMNPQSHETIVTPLPTPPPPELGFTRVRALLDWPKSGKSDFGWGREPTTSNGTVIDPSNKSGDDIAAAPLAFPPPLRGRDREGGAEHIPQMLPHSEPSVTLPLMTLGEEVVNDYRFLELSLRAHPASFLRADLVRRGIIENAELRLKPSGERVTVSGLVTIRQQPGSANGVIFMTIEDETAIANIIVWPKTF